MGFNGRSMADIVTSLQEAISVRSMVFMDAVEASGVPQPRGESFRELQTYIAMAYFAPAPTPPGGLDDRGMVAHAKLLERRNLTWNRDQSASVMTSHGGVLVDVLTFAELKQPRSVLGASRATKTAMVSELPVLVLGSRPLPKDGVLGFLRNVSSS